MTNRIKPYGDRLGDGMVQLSLTLPVKKGPEARQAVVELCQKMGIEKAMVVHMESIDEGVTFFVVYGRVTHEIDLDSIRVEQMKWEELSFDAVNDLIKEKIGRKLVVVGACIGSDAHTVGIDAIFNAKGFAHDWGFERYPWISAHNLRAQVAVEDLASKVADLKADAVLVSRVVTQRDEHIVEFKKFLEVLKGRQDILPHIIRICGGPRITHEEAVSWGYDAGFGPGTRPSQVASFIVQEILKRKVT